MREQLVETLVGLVVLLIAGVFVAYAIETVGQGKGRDDYPLIAHFGSINGIDTGSDVRMAGVKVGVVSAISLDPKTFDARVDMSIHHGIPVPDDSTAKVTTDGLLGSAYIAIEPGGDDEMLQAGDEFDYTQGAVDLLTLLGQFAGQSAKDDKP